MKTEGEQQTEQDFRRKAEATKGLCVRARDSIASKNAFEQALITPPELFRRIDMPSADTRTLTRLIGSRPLMALVFAAALFAMPGRAAAEPSPATSSAAQSPQPPAPSQAPATGRKGPGRGAGADDPFAGQPRIRALVVSGGCCHDYTNQDKLVMEIIRKVLPVDWTVVYQGGTARESKIPLYAESLGHQESWNDPTFQELLVRGFKWALKKDVSTPAAGAAR